MLAGSAHRLGRMYLEPLRISKFNATCRAKWCIRGVRFSFCNDYRSCFAVSQTRKVRRARLHQRDSTRRIRKMHNSPVQWKDCSGVAASQKPEQHPPEKIVAPAKSHRRNLLDAIVTWLGIYVTRVPIVGRKQYISRASWIWNRTYSPATLQRTIDDEFFGAKVLPDDDRQVLRVQNILDQLAVVNVIQPMQLKTKILDRPILNAFVTFPGETVHVFCGLLKFCRTDDELAFTITHEISHVLAAHGAEKLSRKLWSRKMAAIGFVSAIVLDLSFLSAIFAGLVPLLAGFLASKRLCRLHEFEADQMALKITAEACYNPKGAQIFYENLRRVAYGHNVVDPPEIISDHPTMPNRLANVAGALPDAMRIYEKTECSSCARLRIEEGEPNQSLCQSRRRIFQEAFGSE